MRRILHFVSSAAFFEGATSFLVHLVRRRAPPPARAPRSRRCRSTPSSLRCVVSVTGVAATASGCPPSLIWKLGAGVSQLAITCGQCRVAGSTRLPKVTCPVTQTGAPEADLAAPSKIGEMDGSGDARPVRCARDATQVQSGGMTTPCTLRPRPDAAADETAVIFCRRRLDSTSPQTPSTRRAQVERLQT